MTDISREAVALARAFHAATVAERGPAPRWALLSEAQRQNTIRPMTEACKEVFLLPVPERKAAWASLEMVADAVQELFGPVASLESEEATLLRGPEYHHRAEAIVEAMQRVRTALDAAEARQPQVAVKPLEWVAHPTAPIWRCDTPFGTYKVFAEKGVSLDYDGATSRDENTSRVADTVEAAKSAAQADYNDRVRALLVTPDRAALMQAALDLPEVRALVDAAKPYVSPVHNADFERQLRDYNALVAALAALEAKP